MVKFPWVPLGEHEKIGTIFLPMCDVDIQKKNWEWMKFSLKVDTGADLTTMEACDRYSLGFGLDGCEEVNGTNITDKKFSTYVDNLKMRIGKQKLEDVPVAFSKKPIKTLLLGRTKILEYFEICFDNKGKQTIFKPIVQRE
jgi:hypothetical protein